MTIKTDSYSPNKTSQMNMYYSTYRSANEINLSKWKDNLKEEKILEIEEKCYDLMLKFGYKFTLYNNTLIEKETSKN